MSHVTDLLELSFVRSSFLKFVEIEFYISFIAFHMKMDIVEAETLATFGKIPATHFFPTILVFEKHFYQTWDPQNQSPSSEDQIY